MPSKEIRAYDWALRAAFPFLITSQTLSFNSCISLDQELAMYQPIHSMINNVPYFQESSHCLDKYHLFTKPWTETVILKIGKKEKTKETCKYIFNKMSSIFDYLENIQELKMTIRDYKKYYSSHKQSFSNESLCESIESIILSIDTQLKYISHPNFLTTTAIDFLGDSIVEAVNSGLKEGHQHVSTNMTINTSASTQIQIFENQIYKKIGKSRHIILKFYPIP